MTSANHNTSAKHNDLMPARKLEWVTPKISLMDAGDTKGTGKANYYKEVQIFQPYGPS